MHYLIYVVSEGLINTQEVECIGACTGAPAPGLHTKQVIKERRHVLMVQEQPCVGVLQEEGQDGQALRRGGEGGPQGQEAMGGQSVSQGGQLPVSHKSENRAAANNKH